MVEDPSQRATARQFGISRPLVAKMLRHALPPGYRRTAAVIRPKLDPFLSWIEATMTADRLVHRKERHTAKKIFTRL